MIKAGRYKNLLSVLFLTLFLSLFVSSNFFYHSHYENGILVTHSHPYSASKNHSHGEAELSLFKTLALTSALIILSLMLIRVDKFRLNLLFDNRVILLFSFNGYNKSLRAPPTSFVL